MIHTYAASVEKGIIFRTKTWIYYIFFAGSFLLVNSQVMMITYYTPSYPQWATLPQ
jgi:hypothetical protein